MKMKVEEIKPRASEGDIVELAGEVSHAQKPNEGQYGWSQFIGVKDSTGEQNCWIKLKGEEDKVTKGTSIKIKGKLSGEYPDKKTKELVRSINNCDFEIVGKVQAPAQSSTGNDTKDNYWEKKFEWEVKKDKRVQYLIVRQCAIKCATELAKLSPKTSLIKVHTEKDFFGFANEIVKYIYKGQKAFVEESTKEEKIEKAREVVGDFATQPQKDKIYGIVICEECGTRVYGFKCPKCKIANNIRIAKKGFIHSHLLNKDDFKNDMKSAMNPDKLTKIDAMIIWDWWLGNKDEEVIGERAKREKLETARGIVKNKGKLEVKSESEPYPDEVPDSWNE